MSSTSLSLFDRQFHVLTSRLDRLEKKMERLLNNALTEVNNGNKPKDLPLDEFFSRFCTLKRINEDHPTARAYKTGLNRFFKFLEENYPEVKNLNELEPV